MLKITDKSLCCGCGACANICPEACITMQPDNEGFVYPTIDTNKCKNCALCEKTCPVINRTITTNVKKTYASKHKDTSIQAVSSSGGIFSALAQYILSHGGVVFGATFNEQWEVCHQYVETLKDLDKLRRSKYVQSDMGKTFILARSFLEDSRLVLFTGTPCQVAGLKSFLSKEYSNLFTADIFCHGVPSPVVWKIFLEQSSHKTHLKKIDFRDKQFGWDTSFLKFYSKNNKYWLFLDRIFKILLPLLLVHKRFLFRLFYSSSFSRGFSESLYERPSCYNCAFKGTAKNSDITMGDLWGVNEIAPEMYDKKGVSVLTINSSNGLQLFKSIKDNLFFKAIELEKVVKHNPYFLRSILPHPKRAEFFARYKKEPLNKLITELLKKNLFF